ncbi:putative cyclic nucleotide-binding protein [Cupriavidus taiwanensis]|uniref:Crp/Fnr family transcriptional regulator n=1 Tax=Cupriavidus taiwanensis TaxID=164546 RepID=UPI000E1526CE|nr:Crp/Fnr family transcriptional regulator [Cupriavidus taiwanensis]SPA01466.1 putative cyclic nucleotide-binding protein [Cupriavidus taiwanensis]
MSLDALLARSPWAAALTPEQRDRVRAELRERAVPQGAYVIRKGDRADSWLGVVEGLVKVHSASPSGKRATLTGVPAGGWLGEGSLLKREALRYDVVALRDSHIACMPGATFRWLQETSLPFNRYLLDQLNERLGLFIATVEHERLHGIEGRVARALATLFNPVLCPDLGPALHLTQEEVGLLAGISRQRANAALKVLEGEGLLAIEHGAVHVLDLEALRHY